MNAISRPLAIYQDARSDTHPDAQAELARHYVDLRIHALVMLFSAALAGYCGIRVLDLGDATVFGQSVAIAAPPDLLSISAFTVFFAIAALCLLEAHRGWRKSVKAGAREGSQRATGRSMSHLSESLSK